MRKLILLAVAVLALVSPSIGQHYISPTVINNLGQPLPHPVVRVCTEPAVGSPCTNLATIYTCVAQDSSCPAPNPLTGDAIGNFDFYGSTTNIYHLEISGISVFSQIIPYVYMPGSGSGGICNGLGSTNGDLCVYESGAWIDFAGNASGTQKVLSETSGIPLWLTPSSGGAISAENVLPVMTSNAPYPTTTSDITYTLLQQGQSNFFGGPLPGTIPDAYVAQTFSCQGSSATVSCSYPNYIPPSHSLMTNIVAHSIVNTISLPTDTAGDTFVNIHAGSTNGNSNRFDYVPNTAGGNITVSATLTGSIQWQVIMIDVGGVPASSPLVTSAQASSGCSGQNITFPSITTSQYTLVVAAGAAYGTGSQGLSTYTAGSGYTIDPFGQQKIYIGGLFGAMSVMMETAQLPAGTITPTATSDTNCGMEDLVTAAFAWNNGNSWAQPHFRFVRYSDLIDFPAQIGNPGDVLGTNGSVLAWVPGGTGTVTSVSSGSLPPLFTVNVSTATTTPAFAFTLSNFVADNIFGNFTGGSAAPGTQAIPACAADGGHALVYVSHVLTCAAVGGGVASIQFQNNGTPYGSANTGNLTLNFTNCTVSGTNPLFNIGCSGGGGGITGLTVPYLPVAASSTSIANSSVTDNGVEFQSATEPIHTGVDASNHSVLSASDGSFTCYQSDGVTVCVPQLIGGLGTTSLPGSGQMGIAAQADYLMHNGIGGVDGGPTGVVWLGSASGTNTYTSTFGLGAYTAGQCFNLIPANNQTSTTPTLNINSLGALTIVKKGGAALASGDMVSTDISTVCYNGTTLDLINPVH